MSMPATSLADPFTHTAGFGGLCAVIAALIATTGVVMTVIQRNRTERKDQWWRRFVWVVDHSGTDLGKTLTAGLLDQLTNTARQLNDADLVALAERYTRHVYADLVEPSPGPRHQAHTGADHEGGQR